MNYFICIGLPKFVHFFIREKLLRLEHENKMLKLKTTGSEDDQVNMLQSMLDDSDARKNELETDMR